MIFGEETMRIRGRRLYPSTLAERRLMMSLGGTPLYAPRGVSPYVIARRLSRSARGESADYAFGVAPGRTGPIHDASC